MKFVNIMIENILLNELYTYKLKFDDIEYKQFVAISLTISFEGMLLLRLTLINSIENSANSRRLRKIKFLYNTQLASAFNKWIQGLLPFI